jgi:hypothetical protein
MIQFTAGHSARVRMPSRVTAVAGALCALCLPGAARAAELPEIRVSRANTVPACTTPARLMAFLKRRNATLSPRFKNIADHYKAHGDRWAVRWDYAFFQMAIETNFLTYRRPDGRMGDVDPNQNNFAGIGTTGGGVPGDRFPDVSTGVLGQIQHLVAYSGEAVANPVAQRTQLKQEHILAKSRELRRPVRFSDLAKRWAVDPKYGNSIEWVAQKFRNEFCPSNGRQEAEVLPWQRQSELKPAAPATQGSAVRTVWRQGDVANAGADTKPAPANKDVAAAEAPASPSAEQEGKATAGQPAANDAAAATAQAHEPDSTFALFSPPAALADIKMPTAAAATEPVAAETVTVAAPKDAAAPAKPERQDRAGPPAPPVLEIAMGPPPPPASDKPLAAASALPVAQGAAKPANFLPPSGLGVKPGRCIVETATFAGETTVLLKTPHGADIHYVALSVLDGFEDSMTKSFLDARAGGGERIGVFPSKDAALKHARTLCPN